MSTPFFKWINDKETLEETPEGLTGRRVALVNVGRSAPALAHPQAPLLGAVWGDEKPELLVQRRSTSRYGGTDNLGGIGGWTWVEFFYGVNGSSGSFRPSEPGTRYTDAGFNQRNLKIYAPPADGITEPAGASTSPFNNGQGLDVEVAELAVRVMAYYTPEELPALSGMLAFCNKVNRAAVVLPPLLGSSVGIALAAGQLRVRAPVIKPRGRSVEVAWECVLAEDHYARWRNEKADGSFEPPLTDPAYFARGYQRANFPATFPG